MSVRKQQKEETRSLLLTAAVKTFHKKGLHDTRISDIVAAAGVAQGTFYNYFKSKEAIFQQIADNYMNHYGRLFAENAAALFGAEQEAMDPHEMVKKFRLFIRQLLRSCRENIETAQLVFGEGAGSVGPFHDICSGVIAYFISLIEMFVKSARQQGIVAFDDEEMAAAMIFGVFQRSMFYFLLINDDYDEARFERGISTFILSGLGLEGMAL
ncbi:MAG: TetR/AcrR family transcriptional regulator [Thermodesulfobacteriota bacterium]|nr:TetR/AcrR family transcriptional regulator [Thermodesulfobacteriota bacterium]